MAKPAPPKKPSLRGRAAATGLNRAQVVDAAIALLDAKGLDAFSMRALAQKLKVFPTALYWHIGGDKADLFAEISGRLLADLVRAHEMPADWRACLRLFCQRLRARLHQHPNITPLLGAQIRSNGAPNAPWVELVLAALHQAGLQGPALINGFNALVGGVEGFITMELAAPPQPERTFIQEFKAGIAALDQARFPLTVEHVAEMTNATFVFRWKNGSRAPLDGGFDLLVESLILGLENAARQVPGAA